MSKPNFPSLIWGKQVLWIVPEVHLCGGCVFEHEPMVDGECHMNKPLNAMGLDCALNEYNEKAKNFIFINATTEAYENYIEQSIAHQVIQRMEGVDE